MFISIFSRGTSLFHRPMIVSMNDLPGVSKVSMFLNVDTLWNLGPSRRSGCLLWHLRNLAIWTASPTSRIWLWCVWNWGDCLEVLCFNSNMPTKFLNKLVPFIIYQSNCHCCCRILLRSPSQRPRRIARFQPTSLRHQRQLRPLQILEPTVTWICWTQRQEFFTPSTPPTLTWIIKRNKWIIMFLQYMQ